MSIVLRGATISPCKTYRYRLFRQWGQAKEGLKPLLWIMLNPSTADETVDDATIRRCMAFSQDWGYPSMWVGNLYAYRATDPSALKKLTAEVARGPENAWYLNDLADACERVVCAWGSKVKHLPETLIQVPRTRPLFCMGTTKNGSPRHPLYLPTKTTLREFKP